MLSDKPNNVDRLKVLSHLDSVFEESEHERCNSSVQVVNYFSHRLFNMLPNLFNTLGPRQDGRRFPDDIFRRIFVNENS